jgi:hypothetical protein
MKFKTYSSMEYRQNKAIRRNRTERKKLQTERNSYEEEIQESFFQTRKKETR